MAIFSIAVALVVGMLIPFQAIVNSRLSGMLGHPWAAALISFSGGFLVFLLINIFAPIDFPSFKSIGKIPLGLMTGGIIGSIFIITAIFFVPKLGSTAWVALIVTGQLLMSLILDHFGLLGLPIHKVNLMRILGAFMLLGGSFLIQKF